jgi:hypothetical protein
MLICDQTAVLIVQTVVQMYFPRATAESGLAVFQQLAKQNASR